MYLLCGDLHVCLCQSVCPSDVLVTSVVHYLSLQVLQETSSFTREQRSGARSVVDMLAEVAAEHHIGTFKRVQAVSEME